MKRVLQVLSGLSAGGAESMIMNIYRNIDRTKIQFDFCVFANEKGIFANEVEQMGGNIFTMPSIGKSGINAFIKGVRTVIRQNGPYDIIHSHIDYLSGLVLFAAKQEGVKVRIAHSHNTDAITNRGRLNPLLLCAVRFSINTNATDYCGCSRLAAEYMFGKKTSVRATVINNAIDLERFSEKNQYNRENVLRNIDIKTKEDTKIITHIGRFVEQKNHTGLIEIIEKVKEQKKNVVVLLLGDGPLKNDMMELTKKKKMADIHFLGNRKDIPEILHISDLFILPSLYEGLPVTLIEAQAMGVPCVVSSTIKRDVDCGINLIEFVSIDDKEAYANRIIANLDRKKYVDNSSVLNEKGYNIKESISYISDLYGIGKDLM